MPAVSRKKFSVPMKLSLFLLLAVAVTCSTVLAHCTCETGVLPDGTQNERSGEAGTNADAAPDVAPDKTTGSRTDGGTADSSTSDQTPVPDRTAPPDQRTVPDRTTPPDQRTVPDAGTPDKAPDIDLKKVLTPLAASNHDFVTKHFTGSEACAFCHNGISDQQGNDVSIETHWSSTMMANSARDPLWRAKFQTEVARQPKHSTLIQDKCTKCHAPMANNEQKKANTTISALGSGFLNSSNSLYHAAMDGVSCTLCHQIKPGTNFGKPAGTSGHYDIDSSRTIYGPYTNPFPNPMRMHVNYTPTYGAHISSSKLCASCHDLKTPFVDKSGNVIPKTQQAEFPEQMVYSEWNHSDYRDGGKSAKSCQTCHMAQTTNVVISTRPGWLNPRPMFSKHIFVGANVFMLTMMRDNRQLLGITANQFDLTIKETKKMLQSAATVEILQPQRQGTALSFKVKVTNKSGHKLPSGYPSRRVFLHVTVTDAKGKVVFESGKVGAKGEIVGLKSETNRAIYEPHHQEITQPSQVQIYEPVMKNVEGQITHTLLRAASYAKDNRLLPSGFHKATAPSDVKVHGKAATDADFLGGSDIVSYRIANAGAGSLTIKVELVYQTISYPFIQDLFQNMELIEVQRFWYLWNKSTSYAEVITSKEAKL